ncbi:MAG: hypothetical protein ACJAUH_001824, partial [Saprospiraceae bacterium]
CSITNSIYGFKSKFKTADKDRKVKIDGRIGNVLILLKCF